MVKEFSETHLEAYLDESLAPSDMAELEAKLRDDKSLVEQLGTINARRSAGVHSIGAIWRQQRITCPSREQLGSLLLGVMDPAQADYVNFHVERVGCSYCQANLNDLKSRQAENNDSVTRRRNKYFQSSAGYLDKHKR